MPCWYPDLAEMVLKGLYDRTRPSLTKFVEGAGYLPDWDVVLLQTAYSLDPARLSPALLIERVPYTRPESFYERLTAATQRGWLKEDHGSFSPTNQGREVVEGLYELGDRLYAKIQVLTGSELECLLFLSDRVIGKIKELPDPPRKPAFELSLHFDRGKKTPRIVQVRQRIFVLLAFRDDVHIACWRPYESNGQLWEAFTLIWRKQAGTAKDLYEQLSHRNYMKNDYAVALEQLSARGWIKDCGGSFIAQERAAKMRRIVEHATDRYFAAAFAGLSLSELRVFKELMIKFSGAVRGEVNAGKVSKVNG